VLQKMRAPGRVGRVRPRPDADAHRRRRALRRAPVLARPAVARRRTSSVVVIVVVVVVVLLLLLLLGVDRPVGVLVDQEALEAVVEQHDAVRLLVAAAPARATQARDPGARLAGRRRAQVVDAVAGGEVEPVAAVADDLDAGHGRQLDRPLEHLVVLVRVGVDHGGKHALIEDAPPLLLAHYAVLLPEPALHRADCPSASRCASVLTRARPVAVAKNAGPRASSTSSY
jgi:hypothetical protein